MTFLLQLWRYMRVRKKFWLLPIFLALLILGALLLLAQNSALGSFVYTLF